MTGLSQHWTETADRVYDSRQVLLGEDDRGDLWVPSYKRLNRWNKRLDLRRPTHWPAYLLSRLSRRIAFLESA